MPKPKSTPLSLVSRSEYENESFGKETQLPERLEGVDFTDCQFVGVAWGSARLINCRFFDCRFERVDASAADFTDCTLRGTTFIDCKLLGINWTILRSVQTTSWDRCLMDGACFQALALEGAEWTECRLRQADFSEANLRRARFHGSGLEGANFTAAQLEEADFSGASDLSLDPHHVRLKQTTVEMDAVLRMAALLGLRIAGR
jgi:fluoroquinolone resistance protein